MAPCVEHPIVLSLVTVVIGRASDHGFSYDTLEQSLWSSNESD